MEEIGGQLQFEAPCEAPSPGCEIERWDNENGSSKEGIIVFAIARRCYANGESVNRAVD